jgi:hypothetical protein
MSKPKTFLLADAATVGFDEAVSVDASPSTPPAPAGDPELVGSPNA